MAADLSTVWICIIYSTIPSLMDIKFASKFLP